MSRSVLLPSSYHLPVNLSLSLSLFLLIQEKRNHIFRLWSCVFCDFNGAFVFQCFFWPVCMKLVHLHIISNDAEQRVLLVWLYFSFINECKCKVSVCVFVVSLPLQQSKCYRTALDSMKRLVSFRRWIQSLTDRSLLSTSAAAENMNKSGFSQPWERVYLLNSQTEHET